MRDTLSGLLALLLMIVPIAAIPFMAIFGVPQIAPVSGFPTPEGPSEDQLVRQPPPVVTTDHPHRTLPPERPGTHPAPAAEVPDELADDLRSESRADGRIVVGAIDSAPDAWRTVAERLRAIGVNDYRLERGNGDATFLCICQFTSQGDSRIIQRFEAEAPDPNQAVGQVCAQIERWRERIGGFRHDP